MSVNNTHHYRFDINNLIVVICSIYTVLCLSGCDMFNNMPEADLEKKMDDAIAWARAEKISVTIDYPDAWGSSNPPKGSVTTIDTRKGYPFTVEFSASNNVTFRDWIALDAYSPTLSYDELQESALGEPEVFIDRQGSLASITSTRITINISGPITLVPLCSDQPEINGTAPPLLRTGQEGELPVYGNDRYFWFYFL